MKLLLPAGIVAAMAWSAAAQAGRIGTVDFCGYTGLDLQHLRDLMPLKVGGEVPPQPLRESIAHAFAAAIGRDPVTLDLVCCLQDGRPSLYNGMPEPGAPPVTFHPSPKGKAKLPPQIVQLDREMDTELDNAIGHNLAGEDDSKGYSLSEGPPLRALQLKLREYSRTHAAELLDVLHACASHDQRALAAEALGYADESKRQIAGLAYASFDSNREVPNNAIRALGVLARARSQDNHQVPIDPYIPLLFSTDWTDRNKTLMLLYSFTASRDDRMLQRLRARIGAAS